MKTKMKKKRYAVVRHFAFPSILSVSDFKRLTVIDPHNDEMIQYNDRETLTATWGIDRYIEAI